MQEFGVIVENFLSTFGNEMRLYEVNVSDLWVFFHG